MIKHFRKSISITLIFTLLLNTMVSTGFAQSLPNNKKEIYDLLSDTQDVLEKELLSQDEETIKEKNAEADYILAQLRLERMANILAQTPEQYKDEIGEMVYGTISFLYPFYGMGYEFKMQAYPNSKYFKEEGDLYKYLLQEKILTSTQNGLGGYGKANTTTLKGISELEIRNLFIMGSKDEKAKITEAEKRGNGIDNAITLMAYYESLKDGACYNKEYKEAERFAREQYEECPNCIKEDCPTCNTIEEAIENYLKDEAIKGCAKTKNYEEGNKLLGIRAKEIEKYAEISGLQAGRCVAEVLMPLQARGIELALRESEEYIKSESAKLEWSLCGVSQEEGEKLILAGIMSKEEAEKAAKQVQNPDNFWNRVFLDSWKYISISHYKNRAEAISALEEYYANEPEKLERLNGNEKNRAVIRGTYLANSLNGNLYEIALSLMLYGKVLNYEFGGVKATGFGKELYSIASGGEGYTLGAWEGKEVSPTGEYFNLPISVLGREIIHSGGFANITSPKTKSGRALYNKEEESRLKNNAENAAEVFLIAADFMTAYVGFETLFQGLRALKLGSRLASLASKTAVGRKTLKALEKAGKSFRKVRTHFSNWMGEALRVPGYGEKYWQGLEKATVVAEKASKPAIQYAPVVKGQFPSVTDTRVNDILNKNNNLRNNLPNVTGKPRLITEVKPLQKWNPNTITLGMPGNKYFEYNTSTQQITESVNSVISSDVRSITATIGEGGGGAESALSKIRNTQSATNGVLIGNGSGSYYITPEKAKLYDAQLNVWDAQTKLALNKTQKQGFFSFINKPRNKMNFLEKFRDTGAMFRLDISRSWKFTKDLFISSWRNPLRTTAMLGTFGVGEAPTINAVINKAPMEIASLAPKTTMPLDIGVTLYDPKEIVSSLPLPRANNWAPKMTPLFSMPKFNLSKIAPLASLRILPTDPLLLKQQKLQLRREIGGLAAATIAGIIISTSFAPILNLSDIGNLLFATVPIVTTVVSKKSQALTQLYEQMKVGNTIATYHNEDIAQKSLVNPNILELYKQEKEIPEFVYLYDDATQSFSVISLKDKNKNIDLLSNTVYVDDVVIDGQSIPVFKVSILPNSNITSNVAKENIDNTTIPNYVAKYDNSNATVEDILSDPVFDPYYAKDGNIHTHKQVLERLTQADKKYISTASQYRAFGANESAIYRPERLAVHKEILSKIFTNIENKVSETPTFIILGGRSGSGKSNMLKGEVYDTEHYLVINADDIKQMLPEYTGDNAFALHEESLDLIDEALNMAAKLHVNVVLEATMNDTRVLKRRLKMFKDAGYQTEAHYIFVPRQEAAKRVIKRFLNKPDARYVSPQVVLNQQNCDKNFNEIKDYVDTWTFSDNNISLGEVPTLIASKGELSYKAGGQKWIKAGQNQNNISSLSPEIQSFINLRGDFENSIFKGKELNSEEILHMKEILGKDFYNKWLTYYNQDLLKYARQNSQDIEELIKYSNRYETTLPSRMNKAFGGTNPLFVFAMRDVTNNLVQNVLSGQTMESVVENLSKDISAYHHKIAQIKMFQDLRKRNVEFDWSELSDENYLSQVSRSELYFGRFRTENTAVSNYVSDENYSEYLTDMLESPRRNKTYKGVELSTLSKYPDIKFTNIQHPRFSVQKDAFFQALQGNLDNITPLLEKVQKGGTLKANEITKLNNNIAEISYIFANVMPFWRGSASGNLALVYGLYQVAGFNAPQVKIGRALDLSAFATTPKNYKENWLKLFSDPSFTERQIKVPNNQNRSLNWGKYILPAIGAGLLITSLFNNSALPLLTLASFPFFGGIFGIGSRSDISNLSPNVQKFVALRKSFDKELFRGHYLSLDEAYYMKEILGEDFYNRWMEYFEQDLADYARENPQDIEELIKYSNRYESTLPSQINYRFTGTNPLYVYTMKDITDNFEKDLLAGKTFKEAVMNIGKTMFLYHKKINQIRAFFEEQRESNNISWQYVIVPEGYHTIAHLNEKSAPSEFVGSKVKLKDSFIFGILEDAKPRIITPFNKYSYGEYWEDFLNVRYRPQTFKGVKLTYPGFEKDIIGNVLNGVMWHPLGIEDDGFNNVDAMFDAIQEDYDAIKPLIMRSRAGETLTETEVKTLHNTISEISYLFTNAKPFYRGSASANLTIVYGLYELAGINAPQVKIGKELDLSAFTTTPKKYRSIWKDLFADKFEIPNLTPKAPVKINKDEVAAQLLFSNWYVDKNLHILINKQGRMYKNLPSDFVKGNFFYRGMNLSSYKDLEDIFTKGLAVSKTKEQDGIYFSGNPEYAVMYAQDFKWGHVPVFIKMAQHSDKHTDIVESFNDIKAEDIDEVLVWAYMQGKLGWWKAGLNEQGEVMLNPTDNMENIENQNKGSFSGFFSGSSFNFGSYLLGGIGIGLGLTILLNGTFEPTLALASIPFFASFRKPKKLNTKLSTNGTENFISFRGKFDENLFKGVELSPENAQKMKEILGERTFNVWQNFFNKDLSQMAVSNPGLIQELIKYSNRYETTLPSQAKYRFPSTNPLYVYDMKEMTEGFEKDLLAGKDMSEAVKNMGLKMYDHHKKQAQISAYLNAVYTYPNQAVLWASIKTPPQYISEDKISNGTHDAYNIGFGILEAKDTGSRSYFSSELYGEYWKDLHNTQNRPKNYKGVNLSRVLFEGNAKGVIKHPISMPKKGVNNVEALFNAIQDDYNAIEPIIMKARSGQVLSTTDLQNLHRNIAEISYLFTNAKPFYRGSASANLNIVYGLYHMAGIEAPQVKIGRALDLSAFALTPEEYIKEWTNLFDGDFKPVVQYRTDNIFAETIFTDDYKNNGRALAVSKIARSVNLPDGFEENGAVYRGIALSDYQDLKTILTQGLLLNKTFIGDKIYFSSRVTYALDKATQVDLGSIPVLVKMRSQVQGASHVFVSFDKNIKAEDISDIIVWANVGGKVGWHKAVLDEYNNVVLQATDVVENANISENKSVSDNQSNTSAQILFTDEYKKTDRSITWKQVKYLVNLLPEGFVEDNAIYRGMSFSKYDDLLTIFTEGVLNTKTVYHEGIYFSRNIKDAVEYATQFAFGHLPVMVKMYHQDPNAKKYISFADGVKAEDVAEVLVWAEVNGKLGWHKVSLDKGEVVLTPTDKMTTKDNFTQMIHNSDTNISKYIILGLGIGLGLTMLLTGNPAPSLTLAALPFFGSFKKPFNKSDAIAKEKVLPNFNKLRTNFDTHLFTGPKLSAEETVKMKGILGERTFDRWQKYYNKKFTDIDEDLIKNSSRYEATLRSLAKERFDGTNPLFAFAMSDLSDQLIQELSAGKTMEEALTNVGEAMYQYHKKIFQIEDFLRHKKDNIAINWDELANPRKYDVDLNRKLNFDLGEDIGFGKLNYNNTLIGFIINNKNYSEYLYEAVDEYNHQDTYKGVKLSTRYSYSDGEAYIVYPVGESDRKDNNKATFNALQDLYKDIKPIINKYNRGKKLSPKNIAKLHNNIADMSYILTNVVPFFRGTSSLNAVMVYSLYKMAGIDAPQVKVGRALDLSAFVTTPKEYKENWLSLFDGDFETIPYEESTISKQQNIFAQIKYKPNNNISKYIIPGLSIGLGLTMLLTGNPAPALTLAAMPLISHNVGKSQKPVLDLKKDITAVTFMPDWKFTAQLRGAGNRVKAYYKRVKPDESHRTQVFGLVMEELDIPNNYTIGVEYPKVISTKGSDLPDGIRRTINNEFDDRLKDTPYTNEMIISAVNTSGYALYKDEDEALKLLNGQPITNAEWSEIIRLIDNMHKAGFHHTDLTYNLFFRRDSKGKLIITFIDFEYWENGNDMGDLEKIRKRLESVGAKEKASDGIPVKQQSSPKLSNYLIPTIMGGLGLTMLLNGAAEPGLALAALPVFATFRKPSILSQYEITQNFLGLRKRLDRNLFQGPELSKTEADKMKEILGEDFFNLWQKYYNTDLTDIVTQNADEAAEYVHFSNRYENTLISLISRRFDNASNPLFIEHMKGLSASFAQDLLEGKNIKEAFTQMGQEMFEYHKKINQILSFENYKKWYKINWFKVRNPPDYGLLSGKHNHDVGFGILRGSEPSSWGVAIRPTVYSEYLDRAKNQYNHPERDKYKDVRLTYFDEYDEKYDLVALGYPSVYDRNGVSNIESTFNALQEDFETIKPIILKAQAGESLTETDTTLLHETIADMSYIWTNAVPFYRGSSSANLAMVYGLYSAAGIIAPKVKLGKALDLEAFVTTPQEYKENWLNLFDGDFEIAIPEKPVVSSQEKEIPAQVLFSGEHKTDLSISKEDSKEIMKYLPSGFLEDNTIYRGMRFSVNSYEDLEIVLKVGLLTNKTQGVETIFFSPLAEMAIDYAKRVKEGEIPILVKMPYKQPNSRREEFNSLIDNSGIRTAPPSNEVFFSDDIEADKLTGILVWAELDGKKGWWKAVVNENGEVILTPTDNMESVTAPEVKTNSLNLKTDIIKAVLFEYPVAKLIDVNGNVRAYYKRTSVNEIDRTELFNKIVTENNLQNKYSLVNFEYPKILSTNLSDLSDELAKDIKTKFEAANNSLSDMILTPVNTSGFNWFHNPSNALTALKGKPITNEEWAQIVGFVKDFNDNGFYHTDLACNIFFRRDDNNKLVVTIIDFENVSWKEVSDLHFLEKTRKKMEDIGAKEKAIENILPADNNNSSFNLPSWLFPAVGAGLGLTLMLNGMPLPALTLASLPFLASTRPIINQTNGIPAKVLFTDEYKKKDIKFFYKDVDRIINSLPSDFEGNDAIYRGMTLNKFEDLKRILIKGLQVNKSNYNYIYFSKEIETAIDYAAEYDYGHLPIIVKMRSDYYSRLGPVVKYSSDISASDIDQVIVWAELEGKLGWWRAQLDGKGEVVLTPTDNMESVTAQEGKSNSLNLKTDIIKAVFFEPLVMQLLGAKDEVKAYHKRATEEEIERTKMFDKLVTENDLQNKYSSLIITYPKVISTDLSDLPDEVAQKIKSKYKNKGLTANVDLIMTAVNTSGYNLYTNPGVPLKEFQGKPITNEEWAQIVGFVKDFNDLGFYHTDLAANIFLSRNDEGKLVITIIDFENLGDSVEIANDMSELDKIRAILEGIDVKEHY